MAYNARSRAPVKTVFTHATKFTDALGRGAADAVLWSRFVRMAARATKLTVLAIEGNLIGVALFAGREASLRLGARAARKALSSSTRRPRRTRCTWWIHCHVCFQNEFCSIRATYALIH